MPFLTSIYLNRTSGVYRSAIAKRIKTKVISPIDHFVSRVNATHIRSCCSVSIAMFHFSRICRGRAPAPAEYIKPQ